MNQKPLAGNIVVVGAGIVGAAIAFRLAQRGAQVTVVDAGEPGRGASAVSFAWLNARDKDPWAYHDLNRRSLDMWDRFARELGGDVGLTWGGELRWAATVKGAKALVDRVQTLRGWGYPIELLEESDVQALEPGLQTGPVSAASYSWADGHVDTARVVSACLEGALARGARVLSSTPVTGFELAEGPGDTRRVVAVNTGTGNLKAETVVLAVGPDTPAVAEWLGIEVPLRNTFGATIITEPVAPLFSQAAVVQTAADGRPQVSFRQFTDGRVMLHGGDGATHSGSAGRDEEEVRRLLAGATQFAPALEGVAVQEVRRGRRPVPQDGRPILGFAEAVPNLYLATMHSGVTLAALVSEFAAMEMLEGVRIELLEPYRVERFYETAA